MNVDLLQMEFYSRGTGTPRHGQLHLKCLCPEGYSRIYFELQPVNPRPKKGGILQAV